jgi:L,D-transpeptidase catalytic domain.
MKGLLSGAVLMVTAMSLTANAQQTPANVNQKYYQINGAFYDIQNVNGQAQYIALSDKEVERRRLMTEDSYEAPMGQLFNEADYMAGKTWLHQYNNVIVINKKAKGPGAQTIRLYTNGRLILTTKVSTGKEDIEQVGVGQALLRSLPFVKGTTTSHWRHTSRGFYTVKRVEGAAYRSSESGFQMPYAMFFNDKRGLAVHQVPPDIKGGNSVLGKRASSGCVRVHADFIRTINFSVLNAGKGQTPVLDSRNGRPVLDEAGNVKYQSGWKSIVIVEEY